VSSHDTLRWGDTQTLLLLPAVASSEATPGALSKQMLNAVWERPVVWRLMVSVNPKMAAASVETFTVFLILEVGVGAALQQVPLANILFGPPYPPQLLFFDIPAEAMMMQFRVLSTAPTDPNDSVTVTAMCAPHAEPGSLTQIRDAVGGQGKGVNQPDREGLERWMPPGFNDGEVRYR
jgi:hypothetical protein